MNKAENEGRRALMLLCSQGVFLGFSVSIFYTVSNTLFLTAYGSSFLPYVYIATAVFVSLVSLLLVSLQKKWPLGAFTSATVLSFALIIAISRIGILLLDAPWISAALMVLFTLFLQLSLVVLGSQAGRIFNVQQMKRFFPMVMAGQVFGVILGGAIVGPAASWMGGTENLLVLAGAGMTTAWVLLVITNRRFRSSLKMPVIRSGGKSGSSLGVLLRKRYVQLILLFQITIYITTNLVNYLFVDRIDYRFDDALAMTRFLGNFMAVSTLLTLVFLALFSGRLLMKYGVGIGLAANCLTVGVAMGVAVIVALGWSSSLPLFFWLILSARLLNFIMNSSMTDPVTKAMYQPLPVEARATVQTVVDGMGVPLAIGIAGVLLLLFQMISSISVGHIALFTFLLFGLLGSFGFMLFKRYEQTLLESLGRNILRPAEITLSDKSSLTAVEKLLSSHKPETVYLALDMLSNGGMALSPYLSALLDHPDSGVRREAYLRIEAQPEAGLLTPVAEHLEGEQDPGVKGVALRAVCALDPGRIERLLPFLQAENRELREGAMVGLLRHGGIYGAIEAGGKLKAWLESQNAADLCRLARLIGEVGNSEFFQPLIGLFAHQDPDVRREALLAAGAVANRKLLPYVAAALDDRDTRPVAVQALVRFGAGLVPLLEEALSGDDGFEKETVLRIVRISGMTRIDSMNSVLKAHIRHTDLDVRYEILRSLSLCRYRAYAEETAEIKEIVRDEIRFGMYLIAARRLFDDSAATAFVSALCDEQMRVSKRLFLLLAFLFDPAAVSGIADRLGEESDERSLALELLDVTLSRDLKTPVSDFIEERLAPRRKRNTAVAVRCALDKQTVLTDLMTEDSHRWTDWTRACAVYHVTKTKEQIPPGPIESLMDSKSPIVRETSRWAIHGIQGDASMLTVEKVVALKSAEIFAKTSDSSLLSLASITDEVHVAAGETFIRKGEIENCMYLIVQGSVRVHDERKEIARLGEGEIIGEMSLLDPAPRSASITATEDSELFRIDKDAFDVVMADNPEITQGVVRVLCRRLRTKIGGGQGAAAGRESGGAPAATHR